MACRRIPLDKNADVRPIGIGEVPRRIIAKSVLTAARDGVQEAAITQTANVRRSSGGLLGSYMESEVIEAALLVDGTNVFNTLNRHGALHNIQVMCPPTPTILIKELVSGC